MNWIEMLNSPSVVGAPNSVLVGFVAGAVILGAAAAVKYGQDKMRGVEAHSSGSRRTIRDEARAQRNALNGIRVQAGVSAGGQFARHNRSDGDIKL